MNISKSSLKKLWKWVTTIFIPVLFLIDYFFIKTGLSKLLLNTIIELSIRDWILFLCFLLILVLYIWVFLINKKINSFNKKNINKENSNPFFGKSFIQRVREVENKLKRFEDVKEYNKEVLFLLNKIADNKGGKIKIIDLRSAYLKNYEESSDRNFNLILNLIEKGEYVKKNTVSYKGLDLPCYSLTDKGYELLRYFDY